ncbi:hypothetical protein SDC9_195165 [bioreactor metagenome]|uniref:Uncharacterized protein n=1 Tax=bioreactor metagenome TaxID=1076179 RepID=A0A645I9S9_9ZZZZ
MVGHVFIGHDGGGVGVDEDDLIPLLRECLAGLGTCIIELGCLSDDDGAASDDQNFFDVGTLRHCGHLLP